MHDLIPTAAVAARLDRRTLLRRSALGLSIPAALTTPLVTVAQTDAGTATPTSKGTAMANTPPQTGYVSVNGLDVYYEVHGSGSPLVLLHGAFMMIDSFGALLTSLAETRQVIAVEQQAHGHTADVDRPLSYEQMADDTAAVLSHLKVDNADVFGYSMGGGIALQLAIRHPELVRKLVVVSFNFNNDGLYPEILEFEAIMKPEDFAGTPWFDAYVSVAPDPDGFAKLVERIKELDLTFAGFPPETIQAITAPTQVIIGDSDAVRPEHAVELFRLLGGGVAGDIAGLPKSQFAVLPSTTHITILERVDWLLSKSTPFLDAPMPETT